jgi:uncharacterized Zn finger protein (UPF0148 family)
MRTKHATLTPRCPVCAGALERYEGELYCPDCVRYDVVALVEEADAEALELRSLEARLADEEPPAFDPDDMPF